MKKNLVKPAAVMMMSVMLAATALTDCGRNQAGRRTE